MLGAAVDPGLYPEGCAAGRLHSDRQIRNIPHEGGIADTHVKRPVAAAKVADACDGGVGFHVQFSARGARDRNGEGFPLSQTTLKNVASAACSLFGEDEFFRRVRPGIR